MALLLFDMGLNTKMGDDNMGQGVCKDAWSFLLL